MIPRTCIRDPLRKTIFLVIEAPIIDTKKQLLTADPFILYSYENKELCQMRYKGPMNIIYDNETHSICPFDIDNLRIHNLVFNPTEESCTWYTPFKSDEAWQVHQCFAKSKLRENEIVQIKYDFSSKSLLVYCYLFNITIIQGKFISDNVACPNYVFRVLTNSTLKIGNLSFVSHDLKFDSKYNLVPEWLHLINQRLLPDLHSHKIALHHDEIKSRIRKINTDLIVGNKIEYNYVNSIIIILSVISIVLNFMFFGSKICTCLRHTYRINPRSRQLPNLKIEEDNILEIDENDIIEVEENEAVKIEEAGISGHKMRGGIVAFKVTKSRKEKS
jgi:hypothetical protein